MSSTAAPSKRTTRSAPPAVDPLTPLTGETADAYTERMIALNTNAAYAAVDIYLATVDAAAEQGEFLTAVARYVRVGRAVTGKATLIRGDQGAPKTFADVSTAVGVTDKNGATFAGKAYSTLRECYRVSVLHDADEVDEFAAVWTAVEGSAPRNVRNLLTWLERVGTDEQYTLNTVAAYQSARDKRIKSAADAAATTAGDKKRAKELYTAGWIESVPEIPQSTWATWTKEQLRDIERMAHAMSLTADARETERTAKATAEAAAREAAAATGPTAVRKPRKARTSAAA